MVPQLPGWSYSLGANGAVLVSPEGMDAAHIRYEERLRPLRPPKLIVSAHLEKMRIPASVSDVEFLITDEGENAALVTVRSTQGTTPMQRDIGFIFAEDSYSSVSGLATRESLFARSTEVVRKLVKSCRQWLGRRRRRVLYSPPDAWHGVPRGLEAHWYAPAFPREPSRIIAWPALPEPDADPNVIFADLLAGEQATRFECDDAAAPETIHARHGLTFLRWKLSRPSPDGPAAVRELAVASDARYVYIFRLETTSGEQGAQHRAAFQEMLSTVHPVPHTRRSVPSVTFAHWVD